MWFTSALAFCVASFLGIHAGHGQTYVYSAQNYNITALRCPKVGFMFPDPNSLCFVWFCTSVKSPPIQRSCPRGTRVPSWWKGGELNMCIISNFNTTSGENMCLRCCDDDPPTDKNGCLQNACPPECKCAPLEYTYRCECPVDNVTSSDAIVYVPPPKDHCQPNVCQNGGTCQNQWDSYFCLCRSGWTGSRCQTNVCNVSTCFNGGTCVADTVGFHCECPKCWTGSCCNVTIPGCSDGTQCPACKTGANCESYINTCACVPPNVLFCAAGSQCMDTATGPVCEGCDQPQCYIDSCRARKDTCACTKGSCPAKSRCRDLPGTFNHECVCDECWEGPSCNIKTFSCKCNNPCPSTATCKDTPNGPMCECRQCVTGDYCDRTITTCDCNSPCEMGKSCQMVNGVPNCFCTDRCYFGEGCKFKRNTCACNNPCGSEQTCIDQSNGPVCQCKNSCRTGPSCSQIVQNCTCLRPCQGAEVCREGEGGAPPVCVCPDDCTQGPGCSQRKQTCDCSNTCEQSQVCSDSQAVVACACANPCKAGIYCNETINSCECNNPCNINQICHIADNGLPACKCPNNCTTGINCNERKNTCECSPCAAGEICLSGANGLKTGCGCADSCFSGPGCTNIKETCECHNPCSKEELCSLAPNNRLTCGCADACRTGPGCRDVVNTCPCKNPCTMSQKCGKNERDELYCYCENPCMTGPYCNITINTCACRNPCIGLEECVDGVNNASPSCICRNPCKYGRGCSLTYNTCECSNPCFANQICTNLNGNPSCSCVDACKTGPSCDSSIKSCACQPCPAGEACRESDAGPMCYCVNKCRTGPGCASVVNTCECNNPCTIGQECYIDINGTPACRCTDPCRTGNNCEVRRNNCLCSNPCLGYGVCSDSVNGPVCEACTNPCNTGPLCRDLKNTCQCSNPCIDGKVCTDTQQGPQCSCPVCFEGSNCATRSNTCACNNPCSANGRCLESINGPTCRCDACWSGPRCDIPLNTCECNSTCQSYQRCQNNGYGHKCICPDCLTGDKCNIQVDSCKCSNPCKPAVLCQDSPSGTAICKCDCVGQEVCFVDTITYRQECRCPQCFYNRPGERGCLSKIINTCECNSCRSSKDVCINNENRDAPVICKRTNPTSGHSFTVVFEENHTERSITEIPLELYFSSAIWRDGGRNVVVTTPGLPEDSNCYIDQTVFVPENTVYRFPIQRCLMQNGTGVEKLAIRITEENQKPISVYGINKDRWTADGFLAIPDEQAGFEYQTSSFSPAHIATQFAIVALFDETEVTIKLADDSNLPPPNNKKGSVFVTKLQAFETFQVQSRCPGHVPSKFSDCLLDLTGTEILANKKVNVFSGNIRAWVPDITGQSRDHLVEQILPRDRWGTDFAFISIPGRVVGDVLQVMAVNGQRTTCHLYIKLSDSRYNDSAPVIIYLPENNKYSRNMDIPSSALFRLKCDKPVYVTQITKSQDQGYLYGNETFHDPSTMTIPAVTQFTNNFFLNTPQFTGGDNYSPRPYNTVYALLVITKGDERSVLLNQQPLSQFAMYWQDLPSTRDPYDKALVGAVIIIPHGTNIIRNDLGNNFQCIVYGMDDRETYGFPAGMALGKWSSV